VATVKVRWRFRQHFCGNQVCQMVYFQTKNPNLGKFWRVLQWKLLAHFCRLVYFTAIWYILWSFDMFPPFWYVVPSKICIFYGRLVCFPHFGMLYQEKSGNPDGNSYLWKNGVPLASAFLHSRTRERNVIYLMRIYSDCILVEKEKQVFSCVPCFFSSCF
jgi:hypothetical protein